MSETAKCRSCGASIIWIHATTGSLMPLDAEPAADGNVVIEDGVARVLKRDLFEAPASGPRYRSHHSTCPDAAKWRKKK